MRKPRRTGGPVIGLLGALLTVGGITGRAGAQATTPQFFFEAPGTTPTSYTQGLSSQPVSAGGNVTLSVWYQFQPSTAATYFGMDVFIGFDQTNKAGTSATPQNGTVTLPTGLNATTAITNVNPILADLSNTLAGGQDPSNATSPSSALRPYGDDILLASSNVAGFSAPGAQPLHLFDITLNNAGLGSGGNQPIVIYSNDPAGSSTDFTTYLDDGSSTTSGFPRPARSVILSLFQSADAGAMPEPATLPLTVISGAGLLAMRLRRRRSGRIVRHG